MRRLSVSGVEPGQLDAYAPSLIPVREETKIETKVHLFGAEVSNGFTRFGVMRGVFDLKAYNADKAHRGAMVAAAPDDRQEEPDACNEALHAGPTQYWREPTLKDLLEEPIIKAIMDSDGVDPEAFEAMLRRTRHPGHPTE